LPITCATLWVRKKNITTLYISYTELFSKENIGNQPSKRSHQVQSIMRILSQLPIHAGFPTLYFACPCVSIGYALGRSEMK
jgi:hypothetical protein